MEKKTPAEICEAVALDLKSRKITHKMAGEAIGKSKAIISNQISGKKPFSKAMAELFAKAFGYNTKFLLFGEGELKAKEKEDDDDMILYKYDDRTREFQTSIVASALDICEWLLFLTGNKAAVDAWNALLTGDFQEYSKNAQALLKESNSSGRVPLVLAKYISEQISKNLFAEVFDPPVMTITNGDGINH